MQFSKQLLILSDFFFCLLCVIRRLCVFLETFFFFVPWQLLCWEFLLLLYSFEFAYIGKNHSSKITADHCKQE